MNIKTILRRAGNNISKFFLGNSISGPGVMNWFKPGSWSKRDLLKQYQRYVYTIVGSIAENCARLEPEVYMRKNTSNILVNNHELLALLRKPNPMESQFQFLEMHFTYMELMGESFWYLVRGSRTGKPRELYLLRPDLVNVVVDKEDPRGLVKGYVLSKGNGENIPFDKEEIIHFKLPNPMNKYRGMGVIEASQMYIQTEEFASDWTKNSIYNAGRPSGILGIKGTIDEDQWETVKRTFKEEYSGTKNAGKTMLFKDVDGLHYQRLGMELGDIALPDIKNLTRDDIMTMFRVSKTMLGITDDVNRANAREAKAVFTEFVIRPKIDRFMDHINAFLVEPTWGSNIYLSYKDISYSNEKDKIEEYDKGLNKWLTINDIRKERGDKPLKGGDYIYMPISMIAMVGGDIGESTEPKEPQEPEEEKSIKKKKEKKEEKKEEIRIGQGQGEIFRQLLYKNVGAWARKYKLTLNKELDIQLEEILENNKGKSISKKDISSWIPNVEAFKTKMRGILIPLCLDLFKEQSKISSELIGIEEPIETTDNIRNYITTRTDRMLDTLNKHIVDDLSSTIEEGLLNGDSLTDLKKRVKVVYKGIKDTNAEMIARTETIAISNESALESYRQSKIVTKQEWRANPGACEFCEALNHKTVGLYESFALQGTTLQAGDDFFNVDYENIEHPPLHPNCFLHHSVKITTDKGEKNIGDIKVGDMVLTHKGRYRKVLRVLQDNTKYKGEAIRITFRGRGNEHNHNARLRNSFTVTPEHPFLTQRGWVLAKELTKQDSLLKLEEERFVSTPIIDIEYIKDFTGERLYNFSVEEDESYVAKGVVSHNCECTTLPVIEK